MYKERFLCVLVENENYSLFGQKGPGIHNSICGLLFFFNVWAIPGSDPRPLLACAALVSAQ